MSANMWRIGLVAILAIAAAGCAPDVALDQNVSASIHSIAIAGCDHPMSYFIESVPISRDLSYVQQLDPELQQRGLNIGGELQRAIAAALPQKGYEVRSSSADVDAVLECTSLIALYDGGMFQTSFTPSIQLDIALTQRATGKVVFARRFFYTGAETPMGVTVVEADPKYSFSSAAALVADPAGAAAGLRAAVSPMAKAIVDMLSKTKT